VERWRTEMRTAKTAVVTVMTIALSIPLSAQWRRVVFSGKGQFVDEPAAHPLSYFTAKPFLRDDGAEFCVSCTPSGKAESARRYVIRPLVKPVGVLAGFRIVDIFYHANTRGTASATGTKWKSILVQVGPDRYKEIFHLQAFYTAASLGPTRILRSGNESVLATMDFDGGSGGGCWDGYWWFDNEGPHPLDFSALEASIRERLSAEHANAAKVQILCGALNLESQEVKSTIQESHAPCRSCGIIGEVMARFRLDGALVVPVAIDFHPVKTLPGFLR
jgi:hypothetical protein